jgi:hypothetical protein
VSIESVSAVSIQSVSAVSAVLAVSAVSAAQLLHWIRCAAFATLLARVSSLSAFVSTLSMTVFASCAVTDILPVFSRVVFCLAMPWVGRYVR